MEEASGDWSLWSGEDSTSGFGACRSRASCCWRRHSRVITASASAVFVTFRPLATKSSNSGTSHPSSADAGRVLDTPAVVIMSFPPMVIFTAASG